MLPTMQLIKYLGAGLFNTLVGYGIFFVLVKSANMLPQIANGIGYFIALIISFFLNRLFVFQARDRTPVLIKKFAYAFLVSFFLNQIVLTVSYHLFKFSPEIAQIPAMITYTAIFYALNKYYVFTSGVLIK